MGIAQFSSQWEGRTIDGAVPLRQFMGGEDCAVFLTTYNGRDAAVKLQHAEEPRKAEAQLARWRVASRLSHPNLIRIFSTGRCELDGLPLLYIVTEYGEENLAQVITERPLSASEARQMLEPAVGALEYIHRQGLVHAHMKPANIMAVGDEVKISSDGIRPPGSDEERAPSPYDPPERVTAPAGDIWSLGMTLVEVLTQKLAVDAGDVPPDLPEPFCSVAGHCLEIEAEDRWTASQILSYLTPSQAAVLPRRKRRLVPVGAVILFALVAILVAGVLWKRSEVPVEVIKTPASTETVKAPVPVPPPEPKSRKKTTAREKPAAAPSLPMQPEAAARGDQPMPEILPEARRTIRGKVAFSLRADVDPSGNVTNAALESPAGSRYFSDRALRAVRQWKFPPSASSQQWQVHFEFMKTGTKVQQKRLSP